MEDQKAFPFLAIGCSISWIFYCKKQNLKLEFEKQKKIGVHLSRSTKVTGCVKCGTRLWPGIVTKDLTLSNITQLTESYLYRCGHCEEEYTFCVPCYEAFPTFHPHNMTKEYIYYEVW